MSARPLAALALLALAAASPPARAEGPFRELSFARALELAAEQERLVFLDFFTTWCGPCKQMDRTTWTDPTVRAWLSEHAIALKVDAERQVDLARRFAVRSYPTLVFATSDGTGFARETGYRDAANFLAFARGALARQRIPERLAAELASGRHDDAGLRLRYADALMAVGRWSDAFLQLVWYLDHVPSGPETATQRARVYASLAELARTHPPAVTALDERVRRGAREVLAGGGSVEAVRELAAIDRALERSDRTAALYARLAEDPDADRELVAALFDELFDDFLEARRYAELVAGPYDLVERLEAEWRAHAADAEAAADPERAAALRGRGERVYEALLGAGRGEDAARAAEVVLALDPSRDGYARLIARAVAARDFAAAKELKRRAAAAATGATDGPADGSAP